MSENSVESYFSKFDKEIQNRLEKIREAVKELAPQATERICMGIPTFDLDGKWFIHYGAYKKHTGFYPDPETIEAFADDLKGFKTTKGAVQFPHNKPLPMDLIRRMTEYRKKQMESQD